MEATSSPLGAGIMPSIMTLQPCSSIHRWGKRHGRWPSRCSQVLPDAQTCILELQDDAIRNLFSSKTKREYTVPSLTVFVTVFFALAVLTYGIAT